MYQIKNLYIMKKLILSIAVVCLTILSCKKEETKNSSSSSSGTSSNNSSIIGKWTILGATLTENGSTTDVYALTPCMHDNTVEFKSNQQYETLENANLCPDNPPIQTNNWELISNNTKIVLTNPNTLDSETLNILNLTSTYLKMESTATSGGFTSQYIVEYRK